MQGSLGAYRARLGDDVHLGRVVDVAVAVHFQAVIHVVPEADVHGVIDEQGVRPGGEKLERYAVAVESQDLHTASRQLPAIHSAVLAEDGIDEQRLVRTTVMAVVIERPPRRRGVQRQIVEVRGGPRLHHGSPLVDAIDGSVSLEAVVGIVLDIQVARERVDVEDRLTAALPRTSQRFAAVSPPPGDREVVACQLHETPKTAAVGDPHQGRRSTGVDGDLQRVPVQRFGDAPEAWARANS